MSLAPQQSTHRRHRPLQSRLLRAFAATLDPATRAALNSAIVAGVASGKTTAVITAEVLRRLA